MPPPSFVPLTVDAGNPRIDIDDQIGAVMMELRESAAAPVNEVYRQLKKGVQAHVQPITAWDDAAQKSGEQHQALMTALDAAADTLNVSAAEKARILNDNRGALQASIIHFHQTCLQQQATQQRAYEVDDALNMQQGYLKRLTRCTPTTGPDGATTVSLGTTDDKMVEYRNERGAFRSFFGKTGLDIFLDPISFAKYLPGKDDKSPGVLTVNFRFWALNRGQGRGDPRVMGVSSQANAFVKLYKHHFKKQIEGESGQGNGNKLVKLTGVRQHTSLILETGRAFLEEGLFLDSKTRQQMTSKDNRRYLDAISKSGLEDPIQTAPRQEGQDMTGAYRAVHGGR